MTFAFAPRHLRGILHGLAGVALWLAAAGAALAHEVRPAIGDLWVEDGRLRLELSLNAEAVLAGIDLDGLDDTDMAEDPQAYDALRAAPPAQIAEQMRAAFPDIARALRIETQGPAGPEAAELRLEAVEVLPAASEELPRETRLDIRADLPGAGPLVLHWPDGFGDLVLRQQGVEEAYTGYVAGGGASDPIPVAGGGAQGGLATFASYVPVGFDHILPKGLDHILFVLGLFFLSSALAPLLWQITAFTAAHTVTLALGALGLVSVPASVVEPLIAASITYVAVENVLTSRLHRWRPAVVFGFGLLHGLGFASVLEEFGLPGEDFIAALLGFNVGVELGQLTVIALAFLAVGLWFGRKPWYRRVIAVPASLVIAAIGAYWTVERIFF